MALLYAQWNEIMVNDNRHLELQRIKPLYKSFLPVDAKEVSWRNFCQFLRDLGLDIKSDPRLKSVFLAWEDEGRPSS